MKELRKHIVALLLAAVVIGALTALYRAAQDRNAEQQQVAHAALRDLREWDAELDALVLRARFVLLPNFDGLVQTLDLLMQRTVALRTAVLQPELDDVNMASALVQLEKAVADKAALVEDIKSSSAVFRNSSAYLPRALVDAEGRRTAAPHLERLESTTLRALLLPDAATDQELEQLTRHILIDVADPDAAYPELAGAARHARTLLARRRGLEDLLARYLAIDSAGALSSVAATYQGQVATSQKNAERFRLGLYVFSVLLALYVAITLVRLARLNASARRFVPYEFLQLLGKQTLSDVVRGDSVQQEMTVLFSDIRAFASMSARLTPQENFRFINSYLAAMEPAIHGHRGVVNQYLGDGIMALFPKEADDAVQAALAMAAALRLLNVRRAAESLAPVRAGVGINSGRVMLGTIGGSDRMDCGVVGDAVNLASRVEGLTRFYGSELLITASTRDRLKDPSCYGMRTVDRVLVKGIETPVAVFEVWDRMDESRRALTPEVVGRFELGLMAYRSRVFDEAADTFRSCLESVPGDPLFELYLERCVRLQQEAPAADWNGVLRMETK